MTIRQHLAFLLLLAGAAFLVLGGAAVLQFHRNDALVRQLTERAIPAFVAASELNAKLKDQQMAAVNVVSAPNDAVVQQLRDKIGAGKTSLVADLDVQMKMSESPAQQGLVKQAQESLQAYGDALDQVC